MCLGGLRGWKRTLDPLEQELHEVEVLSHHVGAGKNSKGSKILSPLYRIPNLFFFFLVFRDRVSV